jgi:hypothetical protein
LHFSSCTPPIAFAWLCENARAGQIANLFFFTVRAGANRRNCLTFPGQKLCGALFVLLAALISF